MIWRLLLGLGLAGCVDTAQCGTGFVDLDGRCVAEDPPSPYYNDAALLGPDAGQLDAAMIQADVGPDAEISEWANHTVVLIVDLTADSVVRQSPFTPGADIDAVEVRGADGTFVATGGRVIEVDLNAQTDTSVCTDPASALGPADEDEGNFSTICLGGDGAYIALGLSFMGRRLESGDVIEVFEDASDGQTDGYGLYLCDQTRPLTPRDCLLLGRANATQGFTVP